MLAKATEAERELEHFRQTLKLPDPSDELRAADEALRGARSAREEAAQKRSKLYDELSKADWHSSRLTTDQANRLKEQIGEIDRRLKPLRTQEKAAESNRDRLCEEYAVASRSALAGTIGAYSDAIDRKLGELAQLLGVGIELDAEASRERVELKAKTIGGSGALRKIIDQYACSLWSGWRR